MDRLERFYKIQQLLERKRSVRVAEFLEELGVSVATFKRDLEYMRDRFHAPIEWDRETRGYRFIGPPMRSGVVHAPARDEATGGGPKFELPGLWFNASEIRALLTMQHLLGNLQPGLLEPHVKPLLTRLRSLLDVGEHSFDEVERRIRVLHLGSRGRQLPHFQLVASAVLKRQRLHISYHNRQRDDVTEREISPQRLVHYRDNWYVDAWCHLRDDLRSFAVDAIRSAASVDKKARQISERDLDEVLSAGYGIFSGRATSWARLRFSAERARWVSAEEWHPRQRGAFQPDGSYVLEVPFSDPRELVMDVMRHGPHAEVLAPASLRSEVARQLRSALAKYETGDTPAAQSHSVPQAHRMS
jgi:predicted DNA-binding transcriptional regulator YafY